MAKKPVTLNYMGPVKEIALTDFKLRYQGSFLGYIWSLMKPVLMFSVLYFVFTSVFRIGGKIENYPVYLLLGIVFWEFFVETTSGAMDAIVSRGDLIRKIYFPRIILIISRIITALLTFGLNLIAVLIFMVVMKVDFLSFKILWLPFIIIELVFFVMGIAFILNALYVKFRDIGHIWDVSTRALFYATPILYPLTLVPANIGKFMMLNPLAQIIQDVRYILITEQTQRASDFLVWKHVWIPYAIPFVAFGVGLYFFEKSAAKFAEEV